MKKQNQQAGFTLVELLVVIGIIGILMAITIVAINPIQQFQNARNAQRQADVTTILDAVYEYEASNSGSVPANLSSYQYTV
ncbi:MAG: type II secretion system protein, partial [Candidatus Saccharimonadales bacterium]